MIILIIGSPDSGKSALAEKTVMEISEPDERIYMATMIPFGESGRARIERHRRMREGKGFVTIEEPFDICAAAAAYAAEPGRKRGPDDAEAALKCKTVLLECVSNLAANEIFERHTDPAEAAYKIVNDIVRLSYMVGNLVIVSNHFENDGSFDDETAKYAEILDIINDRLSAEADRLLRPDMGSSR